jgi:ribonuclease J
MTALQKGRKPSTSRATQKGGPRSAARATASKTTTTRTETKKPTPTRSNSTASKTSRPSRSYAGRKPGGNKRSMNKGRGRGRGRMPKAAPDLSEFKSEMMTTSTGQKVVRLPEGKVFNDDKLRIYCLGGLQEIGRNCTVIEYNDDIIIIDMGLQFPEENMPGIDYIIPNITSLIPKAKNIRGVFITHGHFDHIGGIPHMLPKLGNPPIYMAPLTAGIVKARYDEYNAPPMRDLTINSTVKYKCGKAFEVEFIRMNHSIPDTFAIVVHTPVGTVMHTGDFKIDPKNPFDKPADVKKMKELSKKGLRVLLADSTNAEHPGKQTSEGDVLEELDAFVKGAPGRVFIGTFASMISRIQMVLTLAEKYGKKVVIEGRSMHTNVEVAQKLGYLKFKPKTIVEPDDAKKLKPHQVIVVGTGAQGQKNAFLSRLATDEHRHFHLQKGDSVIFSSSVIPGNERTIQALKDTLWRKGARVFHYKNLDVHAGGHCKQEDLKEFYDLMKPEYYVPIEAYHYMLRINAQLMVDEMGHDPKKTIVADNGQIMEFSMSEGKLTNNYVNTEYVFVDGLGVGDVSHIVLRDRMHLSSDGMVIVIAQVDNRTGRLVDHPDIISRGFVHMKENKDLINQARRKITEVLADADSNSGADPAYMRDKIHQGLAQFLFHKTRRQPMILPIIMEV